LPQRKKPHELLSFHVVHHLAHRLRFQPTALENLKRDGCDGLVCREYSWASRRLSEPSHIRNGGIRMQRDVLKRWSIALGLFLFSGGVTACLMAQPPTPKSKDKRGLVQGEYRTTQGTVREFTSAPKGERDGLILNDGTWVHWPPHLADRFTAIVDKGDRVKASGYMDNGPKRDDPKLEVSVLTNSRTGKSVENPDQPAPEGAATGGNADIERRLQALEDKMDDLLQEMRRLKGKK
jgi:hypothetical protein